LGQQGDRRRGTEPAVRSRFEGNSSALRVLEGSRSVLRATLRVLEGIQRVLRVWRVQNEYVLEASKRLLVPRKPSRILEGTLLDTRILLQTL
jgi:hypothetical protein